MEQSVIRLSTLAFFILATGCEGSLDQDADADADDAKADAAVTISSAGGSISIDAPPGDYTTFDLSVSCLHSEGPDGGAWSWTRGLYSISTNLDCLDCFVPSSIVVGQPVADHELSACVPTEGSMRCDHTDDVSGLVLADLLKPATMEDGEQVPISSIDVTFSRVHEVWDEDIEDGYGTLFPYPRIDTATASLMVASDGTVSVASDWSFCDDALNSNSCLY